MCCQRNPSCGDCTDMVQIRSELALNGESRGKRKTEQQHSYTKQAAARHAPTMPRRSKLNIHILDGNSSISQAGRPPPTFYRHRRSAKSVF